jgi:hypothetical protein
VTAADRVRGDAVGDAADGAVIRITGGRRGGSRITSNLAARGSYSTRDIRQSLLSVFRSAGMRLASLEAASPVRKIKSYEHREVQTAVEGVSALPGEGANMVDCLSTLYDTNYHPPPILPAS